MSKQLEEDVLSNINNSLNIYGYVVIGPITDPLFNKEAIEEIVNHLQYQPRVSGREITIPKTSGLSTAEIKELKKNWIPHMQSGTVYEPPAFHMKKLWEIREYKTIHQIYSYLYSCDDLRIHLTSYNALLPKEGKKKRLFWNREPSLLNNIRTQYHGMLALSRMTFHCVPGSHTPEFYNSLKYNYSYLWEDQLSQIDPEQDVWNLSDLEEEIIINPGHMIIWNNKLLRSEYVNASNDIRFSYPIDFVPKENAFSSHEERQASYMKGIAPNCNSSGERVYYMPQAWYSFPKKVTYYWERLPNEYHHYRETKSKKKVPCIIEHPDPNYIPPVLSDVGMKLLS